MLRQRFFCNHLGIPFLQTSAAVGSFSFNISNNTIPHHHHHNYSPFSLRFASTSSSSSSNLPISQSTDFGRPVPMGRPAKDMRLYVVEPEGKRGSFKRFARLAVDEAPLLAASVVGVALYATATLAIPHGFGELLDHASRGEIPWATSWRLLSWFAVAAVGNFARLGLVGWAGERMVARLRERLFKAMLTQDAEFFDDPKNRTGALVQRLTSDTTVVGSALSEVLSQGVKNLAQTLGSIAVMLYFSKEMTALIGMMLLPLTLVAGQYGRYVRRLQTSKQDAIADKGVAADERLSSIKMVKSFATEKEELAWYKSKVAKVLRLSKTMVLWNASYVACLHLGGYFTLYSMVWAGSMLIAGNQISAGNLFSFMLYTIYCGIGIMGVTNLFTEVNKGYGASLRLFEIIDKAEEAQKQQAQCKGIKLHSCQGHFRFSDVGFAYPTRPDAAVLKNLTLDIEPGKCTVIVGSSGGGKSSVASLILKLYQPQRGMITLDGTDIQDIDTTWLRSMIGIVPQEPVLFGGTIAQNICYGMRAPDGGEPVRKWDDPVDKWTLQAVTEAAKSANAHDFISVLPQGYDTYVGEGGRSLSGGQKQRVAIARALIRSPQLLILDEATSALDAESEVVVQEAIERLVAAARTHIRSKKAVLMFAHRLSMIRHADVIAVLHDGVIVDVGSFEHVRKNPHFCNLVGLAEPQDVADTEAKKEGEVPNETCSKKEE